MKLCYALFLTVCNRWTQSRGLSKDFPSIYWPRVAFGCLNPVTQNLEDIISFPTFLIFNNHSCFPGGVDWCSLKLPVDKDLAWSWGKICHPKVHLSMGASVIWSPASVQHFMHAYPKLSCKAKEYIRGLGIFSMVVKKNTSLWWGGMWD